MIKIAPSLLAADFTDLRGEIEKVNRSHAAMLHLDVMDGVFVPNISFGFPVIRKIAAVSEKPLDVHLMIVDPLRYLEATRDCGAAMMNVHFEACTHLHRAVEAIHHAGMKAGVTLNPSTPVAMLADTIRDVDMVLLMSVDPGFGGQKFIPHTLRKIAELRRLIAETGSKAEIEVDGGINDVTARQCAEAGADILVAGSAVFHAEDSVAAINLLAEA